MNEPYILDLQSAESKSLTQCGDKGAALAALISDAMPVPAGFVLTTAAFSAFLKAAGLSSIHTQMLAADGDRRAALAERLRLQMLATDLPPWFDKAVSRKLDECQSGRPTLWAVRSSAPAEDAEGRHYDTVLGTSSSQVSPAIRRVWSSVFSERAVRYRREQRLPQGGMAVVVQRLLLAETAGVCSTVDPVWRQDRMFVYANYGLGESVVGGMVIPDTYMVDRQSLEPVMEIMGSKRMQIVACADGIAETGVPCDQQRQFCLSPAQVSKIAKLAKVVESRQGRPVDIQWAYEGGKLYLLQAQPVDRILAEGGRF